MAKDLPRLDYHPKKACHCPITGATASCRSKMNGGRI